MADIVPQNAPLPAPVLSTAHIAGSPASSVVGLAVLAPALIQAAQTFTLPTSPVGWVQIALGVLALFLKG